VTSLEKNNSVIEDITFIELHPPFCP